MRNNGGHSDRNKKCHCTQEIKAFNTCHRKRDTEKVKPVTLCKVPRLQLRKCKPVEGKCGSAQRGDITSVPTIMLSRKPNLTCTNLNHLTNSSVIKLRNKRVKDFFSFPFRLFFFVSIFGVFSSATEYYEEFNYYIRERAEAAKKWAPLVFLHPEERFFPSAVHSFLKNVIPREVPPSEKPPDPPVIVSMSRSLDDQALPEGPEGEDTYLFAPIDLECKNCPLPRFLFGDKPTSAYTPPVYAVISSCLPSQRTFRQARNHKGSSRSPSSRRKFRLRNSFLFRKREARSSDQYESSYGELSYTVKSNRPILKREAEVRHTDTFNSLYDVHKAELMQPLKGKLIPPSITFLPPKNELFQETYQISGETFLDPHEISLPISQTSPDTPNEDSPLDIEKESTTLLFKDSGNLTNVEGITEPVTELDPIPEYPNLPNFTTFHNEQNETISEPDKTRVTREPEISLDVNIHRQNDYNVNSTPRHIGHRFTVTYWMFYPFSQGKEVCTSRLWLLGRVFKPRLRNKCFGESITLNSHVGDWEHISIYFEDGLPQIMYVSMHTYGAFYNYDPIENIFVYRGRDTRVGVPLNPKYPEVVKMDGTHPVLYSALGSHGVWAGPGVHRYENLVPLDDKTAAGVPWELWKNIDIIDNQEPEHHRPDRQWLNFHGKWGNPSSNCHRALFGTCDLASGPTGIPLKRQNFPCHMPNHSTFSPKS